MFVKRRDLRDILDENDKLRSDRVAAEQKTLEALKDYRFILNTVYDVLNDPKYQSPECQALCIELVSRINLGLTKEQYSTGEKRIIDALERGGEINFDTLYEV